MFEIFRHVNKLVLPKVIFGFMVAIISALYSNDAYAHAAEQGFVLLLPTDVYITSGCLSVIASILFVSFVNERRLKLIFRIKELWKTPSLEKAQIVTGAISTFVLFALIAVGFFGPRDPLGNPLTLFIWSAWWIGLVILQGIFGDIWRWINPWYGFYRLLFKVEEKPMIHLSEKLQQWPAVIMLLLFGIFMLADPAPSDPEHLAEIVLGYWLVTFAAMVVFGGQQWLGQGECFTLLMNLFAKLAPIQFERRISIGFFGWAIQSMPKISVSMAVICLVLLGIGSFDGLNETFWWLGILGINPLEFPGKSAIIFETISGLLSSNIFLILVFVICVWAGLKLANQRLEVNDHVGFRTGFVSFAPTILPIAFGYHFAHYLTAIMVDSQYLLIAMTDPLATGADYLGLGFLQVTTGFFADQEIVRQIWLTQAAAVVGSHMLAVLLTHAIAAKLFQTKRTIILSEIPLSLFMIFYTLFGLWLLASPRGA